MWQNRYGGKTFSVALFFIICTSSFLSNVTADTIKPAISRYQQQGFMWCWAASSVVLLKFYVPGFSKSETQVAATVGITSQDDTIPRTKIPEVIMKSSVINGVQQLKATFLNKPLTWAETKKMADNNLPFTIIYNYRKTPYYHCVIYGGYQKDSLSVKVIDPDRLQNSAFYFKTYQKLITGPIQDDIWVATVTVEKTTSVNSLTNSSKQQNGIEQTSSNKNKSLHFRINAAVSANDSYKVEFFNSRGISVYSMIVDSGKHYNVSPVLAQGLYIAKATLLDNISKNQTLYKQFTFIH